jgi:GT2 family glycosyltransferase
MIEKIIRQRNKIPHKLKEVSKDSLRPVLHHARIMGRKSRYGIKIMVSSNERKLYFLVKKARTSDEKKEWPESVGNWNAIIEEYGLNTPVEAYVRLNVAYRELKGYGSAGEVLEMGVANINKLAQNNDAVNQDTLQDWLMLSKEKAELSVVERLDSSDYQKNIRQYIKDKKKREATQPKVAIVSAVSGGYDTFRPPAVVDERFDYVVYSDQEVDNIGIYDIRPLLYIDADSTRSARFVKTNVHKLLPEYDFVVWIDANIMITGDIYPIIDNFIRSKKEFGAMLHPIRVSPFEEMDACMKAGKDTDDSIREQRSFYKSQNYDSDQLIESNILLYRMNAPHLPSFLNTWWNQIDKYSRRDQLSINYSLDVNKVDWMKFTNRPNTARNHPDFALVDHGKGNARLQRLISSLKVARIASNSSGKERLVKGKNKTGSVSVVICVHNAQEDVEMCLKSVVKHRESDTDIIIIDDGSDKDTRDFLKDFSAKHKKFIRLVRHSTAKGYTVAASVGLKASSSDLTILLNSDTIVTKKWTKKMSRALDENPGSGIVGPMSSAASTQSLPDHESTKDQTAINVLPEGLDEKDMNEYCEHWSVNQQKPLVPLVHGFCFGIKREVIETIGFLDHKSFPRGYGEENDYCFRAADAGFTLVIATDTYVYHSKSKSFVGEERKKLMRDGSRAFRDKHGQRRITRAVATMKENPYLVKLRKQAEQLYVKQLLQLSDFDEEVVLLDGKDDFSSLDYDKLHTRLERLNRSMIDWPKETTKLHKNKMVSVIVLAFNHLDMTNRCIDSIMNAKTNSNFELIVVNNGSGINTTVGLRETKKKYPDITLVQIEQNLNYALGNNVGFRYAKGETIVFINNDTYVTDYWLDELTKPLGGETRAVQPLLLYPDNSVQSLGITFSNRSDLGYGLYVHRSRHDKRAVKDRKLSAVTAACLAISANDFARLKGFDPIFINGQEDVDLCLRLGKETGEPTPCYCATLSVVYHDESKTPGRSKYIFQNREQFLDRWRGKIRPNDEEHYRRDGFKVIDWSMDVAPKKEQVIHSPKIRKSR